MRLKFKKNSIVLVLIILGIFSILLPILLITNTSLILTEQYLWLMYFESIALFVVSFLWYKIYNEIFSAKIENGILYYNRLFFIKKSISINKIKGYKTGNEEADFLVLYDNNDNKILVVRLDFYENYYDFLEYLNIEKIGNYHTFFQRLLKKIFRKNY